MSCFCSTTFLSMFFFFNDTATTEIYTLSLHDALPISTFVGWIMLGTNEHEAPGGKFSHDNCTAPGDVSFANSVTLTSDRSEEHTSELQSLTNLVCRLLLEKKKKK